MPIRRDNAPPRSSRRRASDAVMIPLLAMEDEDSPPPSASRTPQSPARKRRLSDPEAQILLTTSAPLQEWSGPKPKRFTGNLQALQELWSKRSRRPFLIGMGALFVILLWFAWDDIETAIEYVFPASEEPCAFVSPVEAYIRDLRRLRALHGLENTTISSPRPYAGSATAGHHTYSSTGHLVLSDTDTAHPIPLLLALGEKRWEDILAQQSKTLRDATVEYSRRYKRPPPKGFAEWWSFAVNNSVVLPDEYDRINDDFAPFFGLPQIEIERRVREVQEMDTVFTVKVKQGKVDIDVRPGGLAWHGTVSRAKQTAKLVRSISKYLPDIEATFSIFDEPQIYLSHARKASLIKLGREGDTTSRPGDKDDGYVRWNKLCPLTSPLNANDTEDEGRSFVYDAYEAMDICTNPYIVPLHGLTIEEHTPKSHPRPHNKLLPIFSLSKTRMNSDILATPLEQFADRQPGDLAWEKKDNTKLLWRGSNTGISMMTKDVDWRNSHRWRLHEFAHDSTRVETDMLVPQLKADGRTLKFAKESVPIYEISKRYFDMSLTGHPIQCSESDGTCDEMAREIQWAGYQRRKQASRYKFVYDIDGNGWSGRFRRLMSSNSVVIKATVFTEWFQPHLIPWFMYIPSKLDFSDLGDIMAFFTGSPKHPKVAFDATAKALGHNGKCFVQRMFRYADLQAYMMRVFLEYARLTAPEGADMDFIYDEEIHGDIPGYADDGEAKA